MEPWFNDHKFSDNLDLVTFFRKTKLVFQYIEYIDLLTTHDLVTLFLVTKSVTKSRFHCSQFEGASASWNFSILPIIGTFISHINVSILLQIGTFEAQMIHFLLILDISICINATITVNRTGIITKAVAFFPIIFHSFWATTWSNL